MMRKLYEWFREKRLHRFVASLDGDWNAAWIDVRFQEQMGRRFNPWSSLDRYRVESACYFARGRALDEMFQKVPL